MKKQGYKMEYLKILDSTQRSFGQKKSYTIVFIAGGIGYMHQEDDNIVCTMAVSYTHLKSSFLSYFKFMQTVAQTHFSHSKADFCEMLPDTLSFREYLFADSYSFRGQVHF